MINAFIEAIAARLKELFPDKRICVDELTERADGKIFIIVNNPSQTRELGGMRKRSVSFDISYVCRKNDNLDYHNWIDKMYYNFEHIKVGDTVYTAKNLHADKFDGIYHFLFDLDYRIYYKNEAVKMAKLKQNGGIKNG